MICVLFLFDDADDDNVNTNEVLCLLLRRGSFPQEFVVGAQTLGDIKGEYIYTWEVLAIAISQKWGGGDRSILHGCSSAGRVYIHTHIGFDKF